MDNSTTNLVASFSHVAATRCGICNRALSDEESIAHGTGPICRKRYLAKLSDLGSAHQKEAVALIRAVACEMRSWEAVQVYCDALLDLGLDTYVNKLKDKYSEILIEDRGEYLSVKTPWRGRLPRETFMNTWGKVHGRFDYSTKRRNVPKGNKRQLWNALQSLFPGIVGKGPKGYFQIPA